MEEGEENRASPISKTETGEVFLSSQFQVSVHGKPVCPSRMVREGLFGWAEKVEVEGMEGERKEEEERKS